MNWDKSERTSGTFVVVALELEQLLEVGLAVHARIERCKGTDTQRLVALQAAKAGLYGKMLDSLYRLLTSEKM